MLIMVTQLIYFSFIQTFLLTSLIQSVKYLEILQLS